MKWSTLSSACFCLALMLILFSCLEELEHVDKIGSTTLEPSVEFPLVSSDFTMREFLTEGNSKATITEQGGLMVLTYDDSLTTPRGELFFLLPNQQSPVLSITGPEISFPSPGATVTISKTLSFAFNTSQSEVLDSILVKAGQMLFQLSSTFPANINLAISIPTLQRQNAGFQQNFSFTGAGNQSPSVTLGGSVLDLTDNGTTSNTITFTITATITDTGQPINNTHRLDCSFGVNNLAFSALFGDLGTRNFPLKTDSIDVDIFGNTFRGNFTLLSPSIRLSMRNSFGVPINFDIQNITASKPNFSLITLSGAAVNSPANPYLLAAPSYAQVGQSITSEIAISNTNSNLPQLISSLPKYLSYKFGLVLNPPPASVKNFVLDTSRLTIGVHLELPFHGQASGLTLSKQYDFDGLGVDELADGKIKLKTVNETPLDMLVQVYFVDNGGTILDSLFIDRSVLRGAPVDANGFTQGEATVIREVTITQAKIDRIEQADHLIITAIASTTNNGSIPVKFSVADKLKITMGVNTRVKYKVN